MIQMSNLVHVAATSYMLHAPCSMLLALGRKQAEIGLALWIEGGMAGGAGLCGLRAACRMIDTIETA
jgi:hypothetical protein